ncbi:MAG: aminodeoxychorismate synthase component I [Gemmatimonadales bacterium]|nr:MAG: aminodeoxychorismate synthase component I [Gemmatimonadales bacterium]
MDNESGAEVRRRPLPEPLAPTEAFRRLQPLPGRVLLETVPPWSGRTLLTAAPRALVRGMAGRAELLAESWIRWGGGVEPGPCGGRGGVALLGAAIEGLAAARGSDSRPSGSRATGFQSTASRVSGSQAVSSSAASPEVPGLCDAGGWFGFLGYELGAEVETLPPPPPGGLTPDLWFGAYDWTLAWPDGRSEPPVLSGAPLPGDADGVRLEALLSRVEALLVEPDLAPRSPSSAGSDWWPQDPRHAEEDATGSPGIPATRDASGSRGSRSGSGPPSRPDSSTFTRWAPLEGRTGVRISLGHEAYLAAVERIREYIRAGDLFQANLTCHLERRLDLPAGAEESRADAALPLYRAMRERSPAPYAALLDLGEATVVSISPESFLERDGATLRTRPIKGTRPRGATPDEDRALAAELTLSEKDRAENVMIVDLLRNDLSRIAKPNSVSVYQLLEHEAHPTVHHLVSGIEAKLRSEVGWSEILGALFPGGSITGAPKIRAMQILAELEPLPRGPYTGAIGRVGFDDTATLSIAIRTAVVRDGVARYGAGGGITLASSAEAEWSELLDKAEAFLDATELTSTPDPLDVPSEQQPTEGPDGQDRLAGPRAPEAGGDPRAHDPEARRTTPDYDEYA